MPAMFSVRGTGGGRPSLRDAADQLHVRVDAAYGVRVVDPRARIYVVRTRSADLDEHKDAQSDPPRFDPLLGGGGTPSEPTFLTVQALLAHPKRAWNEGRALMAEQCILLAIKLMPKGSMASISLAKAILEYAKEVRSAQKD